MQYFPLFLLIAAGLMLVIRPLTVIIHELGHAIPAFLLTRQKVIVYLGSYGNSKSKKIIVGSFEIYFRYNLFLWNVGLCMPQAEEISINKRILYTITGPLASMFIGILATYLTFTYDLHGFLKLFLVLFLGSATFDLLANLIPNSTPIKLDSGEEAYNDGLTLIKLIEFKKLANSVPDVMKLYDGGKYSEAATIFEKMLLEFEGESFYRLTINCHLHCENYPRVLELSDQLVLVDKFNSDDYLSQAIAYSNLGLLDKALEYYGHSLEINPANTNSLNNMGFCLNCLDRFEEAIPFFDKAIELDKDFAYSYNNRGLAKIKTGRREEGLNDFDLSYKLDPENSYLFRNLGIYHFDNGNFEEALTLFEKSKKLNHNTFMIDELISDAQVKLIEDKA